MNIIRPTVPKKGGASRGVSADDVQAGSTVNPQQTPPNLHRDVDDSRAGCQVYKTANLTESAPFSDHRVLQGVGGRIKKPPLPIGSRQSTIFPRYEQVPEPFLDSIRDREGALSTAKRRAGDVAVLKPAKSVSPKLDLATRRRRAELITTLSVGIFSPRDTELRSVFSSPFRLLQHVQSSSSWVVT
ncbi:hypothetical protein DAPPUDRAFT_121026 [Daphnia pulex]|uniref:Uncharacterized protein n=1 Tax=Daphnia pulex TaxID=6669 RepID=E9I2L8_DAPPU|nr:hypothetical protein DAPPUDRAFT_121026 [Daphnia pulex]|eukprot:EFX61762.1 hypothetical protein DAPPUDRAFT_121026 [Daphnia pulex]